MPSTSIEKVELKCGCIVRRATLEDTAAVFSSIPWMCVWLVLQFRESKLHKACIRSEIWDPGSISAWTWILVPLGPRTLTLAVAKSTPVHLVLIPLLRETAWKADWSSIEMTKLPQFWLEVLDTELIWSVCGELITWLLPVWTSVWCLRYDLLLRLAPY